MLGSRYHAENRISKRRFRSLYHAGNSLKKKLDYSYGVYRGFSKERFSFARGFSKVFPVVLFEDFAGAHRTDWLLLDGCIGISCRYRSAGFFNSYLFVLRQRSSTCELHGEAIGLPGRIVVGTQ